MLLRFNLISVITILLIANTNSKNELDELEDILKKEKFVSILFTKKCCACVECVEAEALLSTINLDLLSEFEIVTVKLVDQIKLANSYGVKDFPAIVFLRNRKPAVFDGPIEKEALFEWYSKSRQVALRELNDDSFEHLTQASTGATTGDWLVAFYDKSCNGDSLTSILDGVAVRVQNRVIVAKVNIETSPLLKDRFKIKTCPQITFFRLGKMYQYDLPGLKVSSLFSFVEGWYRNAKSDIVPKQKTSFDNLVDSGVLFIERNKILAILLSFGLIFGLLTIGYYFRDSRKGKEE